MKVFVCGSECVIHSNEIANYVIYSAADMDQTEAEIRIEADRAADGVKVRPLSAGIAADVDGEHISFKARLGSKLSVEFAHADAKPLFLFLYPKEAPIQITENVRYYAPGEYTEDLVLNSGETLYLAEGAVLHAHIYAKNVENVTVCGRGIIDLSEESRNNIRKRMSRFHSSKGITFKDVTMTGSYGWCCTFWGCEDILVDSVNILTWMVTGDGIDVVGTHDVTIRNCFIRTNDDCIVLKSTDYCEADGLANVYNIRAHGCVLWNSIYGNAIEIGFETRCEEIYDVEFSDIDIIHGEDAGWQSGGAITIHNGDRARVHDIVYRDIRVEDFLTRLFDFKVLNSQYSRDAERGVIEDILIENVRVVDGPFPPSVLYGFEPEEHPVRRVRFVDVGAHGEYAENYLQCRMVLEKTRNISFVVTEK